jgi:hypothetical protein
VELEKLGVMCFSALLDKGYEILNFDLQPFVHSKIATLIGDITDSGQVFNAMTSHFGLQG